MTAIAAGDSVGDVALDRQAIAVLESRCIDCHGAAKQKGGLRLDSRAAVLAGGEHGPAAVPGKPNTSVLIQAIRRQGDVAMPPKLPLPEGEAAVLVAWVERGVKWPEAVAVAAVPVPVASAVADADSIFFEKTIAPLLKARCYECHGSNDPKSGLQLTSRVAILEGGEHGPAAVPGKPAESLLIKAISHQSDLRMPKGSKALSAAEVADLTRWVAMGLPWPKAMKGVTIVASSGGAFSISAEQRAWWAFQPVGTPPLPAVKDAAWVRDDLDRFVLAKLESKKLKPATPADPARWLRRATFDLIGLPPTPDELTEFLADTSPGACAKVVDRLLASPRYGERWARHWLDLVRYADVLTMEGDTDNRSFPYRDWVVNALNGDLPYNQFVQLQIAGDLLPAKDEAERLDHLVPTGVLAMGSWQEQDTEREKVAAEIVDQQIDLVGRTFLGLTLACARCHNHKFDPISTADYYGLAGIFFSTRVTKGKAHQRKTFDLVPAAVSAAYENSRKRIRELEKILQDLDKVTTKGAALTTAKSDDSEQTAALRGELKGLLAMKAPESTLGAEDGTIPDSIHDTIGDSRIYLRGSYKTQGDVVPRRFPVVLAGERQPTISVKTSGRLELARWLTDPKQPLTARVLVNRVWQHHFGAGIVRTPGNFGRLGEPPTHPELLDHLTTRFIGGGWSLKNLHRTIMLSATYGQSAMGLPETLKADPENHWLGRMNRNRLEAEAIRDALLVVGRRLVPGKPYTQRTLFQPIARRTSNEFLALFDGADPASIIERREVSTVAPQALFMLNNNLVREAGVTLAQRVLGIKGDQAAQVTAAYRIAYCRDPDQHELKLAAEFLSAAAAAAPANGKNSKSERETWAVFTHALLCANEFLFID
ncbi:hypothetical protein LBMAG53_17060 [Planctomycetota bacterium]|nr:hypothetical protein LBMAG53_17060 [Planctomycetota bacterium]